MSELVPVKEVQIVTGVPKEIIVSNIEHARTQDVQEIHNLNDWRAHRVVAIVGGGSTLKTTIEDVKKYNTVFACGSVHDHLVRNGICPTYTIICDPDPLVVNYLKLANSTSTYLLATQTSPEVFKYLRNRGCKVVKWNCAGSDSDQHIFGGDKILVGGGCTVGSRAVSIAICFGFRYLHFFGFDTCIHGDDSHAYKFNDPEVEKLQQVQDIVIGNRTFKMAGYMLGQFLDFQKIFSTHSDMEFKFFGDGALKYLMDYAALLNTVQKKEE